MSTSLHTRLAVETHLVDGEFLKVAVSRDVFKEFKRITALSWKKKRRYIFRQIEKHNENTEIIHSVVLKY
jgi:hypothetical protein